MTDTTRHKIQADVMRARGLNEPERAHSAPESTACGALHEPHLGSDTTYVCTLNRGHGGEHQAWGGNVLCTAWAAPSKPTTPGPCRGQCGGPDYTWASDGKGWRCVGCDAVWRDEQSAPEEPATTTDRSETVHMLELAIRAGRRIQRYLAEREGGIPAPGVLIDNEVRLLHERVMDTARLLLEVPFSENIQRIVAAESELAALREEVELLRYRSRVLNAFLAECEGEADSVIACAYGDLLGALRSAPTRAEPSTEEAK